MYISFESMLSTLGLLLGVFQIAYSGSWGPESTKQHSGYITVNTKTDNGGHIFYWMFESRRNPETDPVVLWMTGGPGCSSELAVFYENGPYVFNATGNVEINPYSWNEVANVIYVDQPVGTGFSYADSHRDYVHNEEQVAEDMYEFLQAFYTEFPKFKSSPLFITGESYAGHYVPAVSHRIWKGNQESENSNIELAGAVIGNGFVNAELQYPEYLKFAHDNKLLKNKAAEAIVKAETELCEAGLKRHSSGAILECDMIITTVQKFGGNFNVYDIRKKCEGSLCYDFSRLDKLMEQQDFRDALGVSPKAHWSECNKLVYAKLAEDWVLKCDKYLVPLLNDGLPVLVYSGDQDFICNYYGGRAWTNALEWNGKNQFAGQSEVDYVHQSKVSGSIKSFGPLTFLVVSEAGHMVPMDQPQLSLHMICDFINGQLQSSPISLPENAMVSVA